jgi:ferredoxin
LESLHFPLGADYYLCGPAGYLSDTTAALRSLGIPEAQIKSEIFGDNNIGTPANLKPHLPADNTGTGPLVSFTKSNISFRWNPRFENILEAAEACDVPVHWSCRVGVCHRCESSLIDGNIEYTSPPLDPPGTGRLLICCSAPVTNIELDL